MAARSAAQRTSDVLDLLAREEDAWVASAGATGEAYLIPLSYHWDGSRLVFATLERSKTARNLRRAGRARVSLPSTRDVVILEGPVAFIPIDADTALADAFAARLNWDPRHEPEPYVYFALTPDFIQAWRDVEELTGRTIMRGGVWQE
ncbi:MAG TPA: pyridoxamine 5'-phosphate oxidase family protein [Thermomicrobiales bacterium]|nr:pyridoxamine 5'-phosphate oxidase family protein [Thermomicrobiales bacterium]